MVNAYSQPDILNSLKTLQTLQHRPIRVNFIGLLLLIFAREKNQDHTWIDSFASFLMVSPEILQILFAVSLFIRARNWSLTFNVEQPPLPSYINKELRTWLKIMDFPWIPCQVRLLRTLLKPPASKLGRLVSSSLEETAITLAQFTQLSSLCHD